MLVKPAQKQKSLDFLNNFKFATRKLKILAKYVDAGYLCFN